MDPAAGAPERWLFRLSTLLLGLAWLCLAAGTVWWVWRRAAPEAAALLSAGLLGLLALPVLRLASILAGAVRERDRVTIAATLAVIAILVAFTLRDAAAR